MSGKQDRREQRAGRKQARRQRRSNRITNALLVIWNTRRAAMNMQAWPNMRRRSAFRNRQRRAPRLLGKALLRIPGSSPIRLCP